MRIACFLAIICGVLSPARLWAQTSSEPGKLAEYADADGYVVLSALLDQYAPPHSILIISPETSSEIAAGSFDSCEGIPDEFKVAARDFDERNKRPLRLTKRFQLRTAYNFADSMKRGSPSATSPGEQELPPHLSERMVYVVSAVGFDAARTHAIAYVALFCGAECGGGGYHLLVKGKSGWKEVEHSPVCFWISYRLDESIDRRFS